MKIVRRYVGKSENHDTYNVESPRELIPACVMCENSCHDIIWGFNPYMEEVHLMVKHDWFCHV